LAYQPPASSTFLSEQISQQYFSLRTNQHQPSATSQTNRLSMRDFTMLGDFNNRQSIQIGWYRSNLLQGTNIVDQYQLIVVLELLLKRRQRVCQYFACMHRTVHQAFGGAHRRVVVTTVHAFITRHLLVKHTLIHNELDGDNLDAEERH
jgi:hypothetical protein